MLEHIIKEAQRTAQQHEDSADYIGENGLIYCGKCRTAKQIRLPYPLEAVMPCMCKCMAAEYEAEKEAEREQARQEIRDRRRYDAFHSTKYRDATFAADDGGSAQLMRVCKGYVKRFVERFHAREPMEWLLLYGDIGVGKSYAAAAVVNMLIDKGFSGRFTTLSEIERELWGAEHKSRVYESLRLCDIMVLDDLGAERDTEYMQEIMYNVIDQRLRANKPMIVTTNLDQKAIMQPQDVNRKRIMSRLMEKSVPYLCKGTDRRMHAMRSNAKSVLEDLLNG